MLRTPPPVWTRACTFAQIASITGRFGLPPVERGIEVDDVDPTRAGGVELPRDRDGVVGVDGLGVVVAAREPDHLTVAEVDRREEIHQRPTGAVTASHEVVEHLQADRARLLRVELRRPDRSDLDRGREPPPVLAPRADDRVVVGFGGEGMHEVEPRRIREPGAEPGPRGHLERVPTHLREANGRREAG